MRTHSFTYSMTPGNCAAFDPAAPPLHRVPAAIAATGPVGVAAFIEFFVATLRNSHKRLAYSNAVAHFSAWMDSAGIADVRCLQAWHIAAYIEQMSKDGLRPATVKQGLAAIRQTVRFPGRAPSVADESGNIHQGAKASGAG